MSLSVGVVFAIILVLASPILWVVWRLLADLGERSNASRGAIRPETVEQWRRRAA